MASPGVSTFVKFRRREFCKSFNRSSKIIFYPYLVEK